MATTDYKDTELYLKIKSFIRNGFSIIKNDLDRFYEIRREILTNHQNNRFYTSILSPTKPDFSHLIERYRSQIEKLSEYDICDEFMKKHEYVSKFINHKVGTECDFQVRLSSYYLFSFLKTIAEIYFVTSITKRSLMKENEFFENFDRVYLQYESVFFNGIIPTKNIIPLHHFIFNTSEMNLDNNLKLKKISHVHLKLIFDISTSLRLETFDIGESPYVLEEMILEPVISSKGQTKKKPLKVSEVHSLITLLRLFKKGNVSYSYIFPIKDTVFPFNLCKPNLDNPYVDSSKKDNYILEDTEIPKFLNFWNDHRNVLLKINSAKTKWANIHLALGRFNSSYNRASNKDRFIDLSIAIEALFSRGSGEDIDGSLTHKYLLRVSRFLGTTLSNYREYYKNMQELYSLRSKIVHGKTETELIRMKTNLLEDYVRKSLKKYLDKINKSKLHKDILDEMDYVCVDN
jgi:hypothetical protein